MRLFDKKQALLYASTKSVEPIFVQYLGSTGTQWIDTGYVPTEKSAMEITYQLVDGNKRDSWFIIAGCFNPSSKQVRFQIGFNYKTNQINAGYGARGILIYGVDEQKHTIKIDGFNKKVLFDGDVKSTSLNPGNLNENQSSIYLFTANQSGTVAKVNVNIYSVKISENGELIYDLRPCLHPKTLDPVLYDTIHKKYYYNLGTGTFMYER